MSRELRWNLAVALVAGVVLAASPHTSSGRLVVKLSGGVVVAVAAYLLGLGARLFPARSAADASPVAAPPKLLLALVLLAFAFAPTAAFLVGQWTRNIWLNGHGVFLPFVIGYLVWRILARDRDPTPEASPWGWPFVIVGLALVVLDTGIGTRYIAAGGLVVTLPGLCLLLLGARRTRDLALPLVLCAFLVPLPTLISTKLGLLEASVNGVTWLLRTAGLATLREGPVVLVSDAAYSIGYNCTGFSFVYGGLAAAVLFAWTARSPVRKALLLLAPLPLAVVWNVARLTVLIVLAVTVDPRVVHSFIHGLSGIVAFWACVLSLYAMADREGLRRVFA